MNFGTSNIFLSKLVFILFYIMCKTRYTIKISQKVLLFILYITSSHCVKKYARLSIRLSKF